MDLSKLFSISSLKGAFGSIRTVFIILDVILVFFIIYIFFKSNALRPRFISRRKVLEMKMGKIITHKVSLRREWSSLEKRAESTSDESLGMLIIEADKIADEALKQLGCVGNTMLERIQSLVRVREVESLEIFWKAHKFRNNIVHTPSFRVSRSDVERYLASYKEFLRELKCI